MNVKYSLTDFHPCESNEPIMVQDNSVVFIFLLFTDNYWPPSEVSDLLVYMLQHFLTF